MKPGLGQRLSALAAALSVCAGCGSDGNDAAPPREPGFLDDPLGELPLSIEELGLYPDPSDRSRVHPAAQLYDTAYPLWSSGSAKQRYVVVPAGQAIDASSRDAWSFPDGTIFFKTFAYPGEDALAPERPIETRVLRWVGGKAELDVYRWDDAGATAELIDISRPSPVPVTSLGESFEHVIPARLDCRKCHESQPVPVLGFDELGLAEAPPDASDIDYGAATSPLAFFAGKGWISGAPAEPRRVLHDDPRTQDVLRYIEGNCTHCHNGGTTASASYDLRYTVALENLIDRDTEGKALSGLRVASGNPQASALFLAMGREPIQNIQPMPPVGIDRRDEAALQLFEAWINSLPTVSD